MMIAYSVQKRRRFAPLHRERREPFRTGHAVIFTASAGPKHHLSKIVNQAAPAGKQCIGLHAVPSFYLTSPRGDELIPVVYDDEENEVDGFRPLAGMS